MTFVVERPGVRRIVRTRPPCCSTVSLPTIAPTFQSPPLTSTSGINCPMIFAGVSSHRLQRGQHHSPVGIPVDRTPVPLDASDGGIRIQSYDQHIAKLLCLRQILHVAAVDDIERPVRKDHTLSFPAQLPAQTDELLEIHDFPHQARPWLSREK